MDDKPKTISEYKRWLKREHKVNISSRIENNYTAAVRDIRQQFSESTFWKELNNNLSEYEGEYLVTTGYRLFQDSNPLELDIKGFDSFLLKTFRKNILENSSFPDAPSSGWVLPDNWFGQINDTVRTLIKVKYLDGVKFIVDKCESLCKKENIDFNWHFQAQDVGYYAVHLYAADVFSIIDLKWKSIEIKSKIEIQITTQLQELIRTLLHKYYERRRISTDPVDESWKWNYKNDEFSTSYLGHILHYLEGMIMEIREKERVK